MAHLFLEVLLQAAAQVLANVEVARARLLLRDGNSRRPALVPVALFYVQRVLRGLSHAIPECRAQLFLQGEALLLGESFFLLFFEAALFLFLLRALFA